MFFVAAGKPGLGIWLSIAGGVTNMVLDYVLIAVIPLGIAGAAVILSAQTILSARPDKVLAALKALEN